jgi:hypothetical protein
MRMRDNKIFEVIAFFDTIEFTDLWSQTLHVPGSAAVMCAGTPFRPAFPVFWLAAAELVMVCRLAEFSAWSLYGPDRKLQVDVTAMYRDGI